AKRADLALTETKLAPGFKLAVTIFKYFCSFSSSRSELRRSSLFKGKPWMALRHAEGESVSFDKVLRTAGKPAITSSMVTGGYDRTRTGNGAWMSDRTPKIIMRCLVCGTP